MFREKVAVITGGGSGIGKATALAFAKEGAKVFIIDINKPAGLETVAEIEQSGGTGCFYQADVSKATEVQSAIEQCVATYGQLDYAFNNAGIVVSTTTTECTEEIWEKIMNTNLKGVWLCMKYELHVMIKQSRGVIVNTSSISGLIGRKGDMPYTVSKHGIIGLTKTAALEYAANGIRINCVCPGSIHTPWVKKVTKRLNEMHPLGRIGTPEEVADAVLWLCSDKAAFVTGHSLVLDGGRTAGEW